MKHVQAAREMVGTPWAHQGRGADGVDCVGLLVRALYAAGVELGDVTDYGRDPHGGLLEGHLTREFGPPVLAGRGINAAALQAGDLVVIAFKRAPRHVAIVADHCQGGLSLIHTYQSTAVNRVTEHRLDHRWLRRLTGVWRVPSERFA